MKIVETKININLKILPFGHAQIVLKGFDKIEKYPKGLKQFPQYGEPKTTNQQSIEIIFGGEEFKVPKTTSGLF